MKVLKMPFIKIYELYLKKIENKNRNKQELDEVISWLTGYEKRYLNKINKEISLEEFFENCPNFNSKAKQIKGKICGVDITKIENPLIRKVRIMDKLIDELAKGKDVEKILKL